jgi:hypothetical protein
MGASGLTLVLVMLLAVDQVAAMPSANPQDDTDCKVFGDCKKPEDQVQNYYC